MNHIVYFEAEGKKSYDTFTDIDSAKERFSELMASGVTDELRLASLEDITPESAEVDEDDAE